MNLYRYVDKVYATVSVDPSGNENYGSTQPIIELHEFTVIKTTPRGFWIRIFGDLKKWVSNYSHKRFAHLTKDLRIQPKNKLGDPFRLGSLFKRESTLTNWRERNTVSL